MGVLTSIRKYVPTRPIAKSHWSLLAGMLVVWELVLTRPCPEGPRYLELGLATATLFIVLWHADLRKDVLQTWPRVARVATLAFYDLCTFFLLFILFAVPLLAWIGTASCYTDRARMTEAILAVSPQRATITERATKEKSLIGSGMGLSVEATGIVSGGAVSPNGVISFTTDKPPGVVVLRPRWEEGEVKWYCGGAPAKNLPGSCRDPMVWD